MNAKQLFIGIDCGLDGDGELFGRVRRDMVKEVCDILNSQNERDVL